MGEDEEINGRMLGAKECKNVSKQSVCVSVAFVLTGA